jgi:hypothetical protein
LKQLNDARFASSVSELETTNYNYAIGITQ